MFCAAAIICPTSAKKFQSKWKTAQLEISLVKSWQKSVVLPLIWKAALPVAVTGLDSRQRSASTAHPTLLPVELVEVHIKELNTRNETHQRFQTSCLYSGAEAAGQASGPFRVYPIRVTGRRKSTHSRLSLPWVAQSAATAPRRLWLGNNLQLSMSARYRLAGVGPKSKIFYMHPAILPPFISGTCSRADQLDVSLQVGYRLELVPLAISTPISISIARAVLW